MADQFNVYSQIPIVRTIPYDLRQRIIRLQVIEDGIRNHNIVFITDDDRVWTLGDNVNEMFDLDERNQPIELISLNGKRIVQMVSGHRFVWALTEHGNLWSWGMNTLGQLASPERNGKQGQNVGHRPGEVSTPFVKSIKIVSIALGHSFGSILTDTGRVYTFGDNRFGQLGLCDRSIRDDLNPILDPDTKMIDIAAGANHLILLSTDRKCVYSCGDNRMGQLGHPSQPESDTITCIDRPTLIQLSLNTTTNIRSIGCGRNHTLILTNTGLIYAFGDNRRGQVAINNNNSCSSNEQIVSIPHLVQVDDICDRLYTINLSDLSVARSATVNDRLYVWGMIKMKRTSRLMAENPDQSLFHIVRQPKRSNIIAIGKLFTVYEANGLTYNNNDLSIIHSGRPSAIGKWFDHANQSDVQFMISGKTIFAHKKLLSTYSEYFCHYFGFETDTDCQNELIPICDFSYETYRNYIHFIYTGELFDSNDGRPLMKRLIELIDLSLTYDEMDLYERCTNEIDKLLIPSIVTDLYDQAYRYQLKSIMEQCSRFIITNWTKMLEQINFEQWLSCHEHIRPSIGNLKPK
ncbi:RCC1 and BTB domain-containing protein 2 [Blomia tropicalis]|nr:RCC1 and BTB domain-containing protein 2 [Blomia tropicalis]